MHLDLQLYRAVNGLAGQSAVADAAARAVNTWLPLLIAAWLLLVFAVSGSTTRVRHRQAAIAAAAAAAAGLAIAAATAQIVARPPAYASVHAHLLVGRSHGFSFPSDRTTAAFAIGSGVWLYKRRIGVGFLVLAVLLALTRVYVGAEYPGDVAAGAVIGAAAASMLWWWPLRRRLDALSALASSVYDRVLEVNYRLR